MKAGEQLLQGAGATSAWRGASSSTVLTDGTLHLLLHQDELEMPNSTIYTTLPQAGRVLSNDLDCIFFLWGRWKLIVGDKL